MTPSLWITSFALNVQHTLMGLSKTGIHQSATRIVSTSGAWPLQAIEELNLYVRNLYAKRALAPNDLHTADFNRMLSRSLPCYIYCEEDIGSRKL